MPEGDLNNMNLKREIWEIILSAVFLALFVKFGLISPEHSLLGNIATAIVMYIIIRILAFILS